MTDLDSEYYIAQCAEKDIEIERNRAAIAELVKALKGMGDMWTSVCMSHGWDPSHLEQFDVARAAITKHTTTTKEGN